MTDQTAIVLVVVLAAVVVGLFVASSRSKRRHEAERRARRIELDRIKREARARESAGDSAGR